MRKLIYIPLFFLFSCTPKPYDSIEDIERRFDGVVEFIESETIPEDPEILAKETPAKASRSIGSRYPVIDSSGQVHLFKTYRFYKERDLDLNSPCKKITVDVNPNAPVKDRWTYSIHADGTLEVKDEEKIPLIRNALMLLYRDAFLTK